jgi:hypothetical protein
LRPQGLEPSYYSLLSNGLSLNVCGRTHTHTNTHTHTHTHTMDTQHRRVLVKREMFSETLPVSEIRLRKDNCSVGALCNVQEQGSACTGMGLKPSPTYHKESLSIPKDSDTTAPIQISPLLTQQHATRHYLRNVVETASKIA